MKTQLILATLIAAGFGTTAIAQDAEPAAEEEKLAVLPEFEAIDANENGTIDAPESEMLSEALEEQHKIAFQFETVDRNRDGLIDVREYVAYDVMLKERLGIA
jgi:Ca2+-binding EF-hand superfamily protein